MRGSKKRAELLPVCSQNLEKSKCCESIVPWIQNGPKMDFKKRVFSILKSPDHICFHYFENMKNCAYARFFRSIYSFFLFFENVQNPKKTEKCPKNCVFPYALHHFFQSIRVTHYAYNLTFCTSK
jgi:hypothetical protein